MKEIEIIKLDEFTPFYEGYSELIRFKNKYYRTRDTQGYSSWLEKINKKEYNRLLKYKNKQDEMV